MAWRDAQLGLAQAVRHQHGGGTSHSTKCQREQGRGWTRLSGLTPLMLSLACLTAVRNQRIPMRKSGASRSLADAENCKHPSPPVREAPMGDCNVEECEYLRVGSHGIEPWTFRV